MGPSLGRTFLMLVDAFLKWLEVMSCLQCPQQWPFEKLRSIIATHGLPQTITSDNAMSFTSAEFQYCIKENEIHHTTRVLYHPSTNELVQESIKHISEGSLESNSSRFLFQYQITPHSVTGMLPSQLLLNCVPRSRLDLLYLMYSPSATASGEAMAVS